MTHEPTPEPSFSPTVTHVPTRAFVRPVEGRPTFLAGGGSLLLAVSSFGELFRLYKVDQSTGAELLAGRSYDGHEWESGPAAPLLFSCGADEAEGREAVCSVHLPAVAGFAWAVDASVDRQGEISTDPRAAAARLLTQATFGPTRKDIAAVVELGSPAAWLRKQMDATATPATLHRAYFR
jgi:hypothetical protein